MCPALLLFYFYHFFDAMREGETLREHQNTDSQAPGGWWLRLTAPPGAGEYGKVLNQREREHLRHSQLTSYIAPFVFVAPLLLLQQAFDIGTAIGIAALMSMSILALVLNRVGQQVLAALLLVFSMDIVIEGALVTAAGGLGSGWLLTFDLFVIPLIIVGILLNRRFLWIFILIHIACILGDFYLLPHAPDLTALIALWHGPAVVFVRPIIIQIGGGLLGWLAVRSTDEAIVRADQAEVVAELQKSIAQEKKQLEDAIQELLTVLTHAANGFWDTRASLSQDNTLWRISAALNTLFARVQNGRQVEEAAQHLLQDLTNLTRLVRLARTTGQAVSLPALNNGPLDPLIRELQGLPLFKSASASSNLFSRSSPWNQ